MMEEDSKRLEGAAPLNAPGASRLLPLPDSLLVRRMTMMAAMTAMTTTTADTMMAVSTPVDRSDPLLEGFGDTAVLSGGAGDADADGDRLNDGDCAHGKSVNRGQT